MHASAPTTIFSVPLLHHSIHPLQDVVFNFVCAVLIFCAAVALATYIPQGQQLLDSIRTIPELQVLIPTLERILAAGVAATVSDVISSPQQFCTL